MKNLYHNYIVSALVFSFVFFAAPLTANAGMFDAFVSKVKITFFSNEEDAETVSSSKKIALLSPSSAPSGDEESYSDVLEVKSGPMRLSTEEIDYPLEDTITLYEVKEGDSLASVAKLFGVTVNTIVWANDLPSNKSIKEGDVLVILPVTGIKYQAKKGDTLPLIAKKYKGAVSEIAKFNGISEDSPLAVGQELIIPEGEVVSERKAPSTTPGKTAPKKLATAPLGFFVKPLASFVRSQGIHGKNAVDLAGKVGAPVVATAAGKVIIAKTGSYNGGYGNMIVISHKNNVQTLYAHLSQVSVVQGATVEQGQVIGALGNTGKSTGPHLHIEVRGAANPF